MSGTLQCSRASTYDIERAGEYVWSPKRNKAGKKMQDIQ